MFENYRVIRITKNIEGGEAHNIDVKKTLKDAMDAFYNQLSSYGTNPSTKICEVIVLDPNGEITRMEVIDNSKYS